MSRESMEQDKDGTEEFGGEVGRRKKAKKMKGKTGWDDSQKGSGSSQGANSHTGDVTLPTLK